MQRIAQALKIVALTLLCGVLGGALFLGYRAYKAVQRYDERIAQYDARVTHVLDRTDATLTSLNRDLIIVSGTLTTVEKSSRVQAKSVTAAMDHLNEDLTQLNGLISDARTQVNALGPATEQSVRSLGAAADSLNRDAQELQPVIKNAAATTAGLAELTNDPSIKSTLDSTAKISASTALTADHIEKTTADVQEAVHRATRPVHSTWGIFKEVIQLAFNLKGLI